MNTTHKAYWNVFDLSNYFAQRQDSLDFRKSVFNTDAKGNYFPSEQVLNPVYRTEDNGHVGVQRFYSIERVDTVFVFLLLCFMLLVRIYRKGSSFFKENMQLLFSSRDNVNFFNESTVSEFWYNLLLNFQTIFLSAIVVFIYLFESDPGTFSGNQMSATIFSFVLLITLFVAGKCLFYKIIGFLFDIQSFVSIWIRTYTAVIEMLGILAFIPVLLLVYFDYYHSALFIIFFLLFILSRLIIIYRLGCFFLAKGVNFLYLIAYLCSVEIIPYILLYNGLVYLYRIDIINILWH